MSDRQVRFIVLTALLVVGACSGGAPAAAKDIEAGVKKLGSAEGARTEVSYVPGSCSGSYTVRIEKGTATDLGNGNFRINAGSGPLMVGCEGSGGSGTTHHLRFVDVPASVEITKNGGEAAVIEIQRVSGRPVVVGLR